MRPPISAHLLEEADRWDDLSRWERAELGRSLRRIGLSYGEIMDLIPVPKGTLAGWCRDVPLSPEQIDAIVARTALLRSVPRDTQRKRRAQVAKIRAQAAKEVPGLARDPLWVAGTAMYWAEGAKTQRLLMVSNTDPRVLRLFLAWVRSYLISDPGVVLMLHLHTGNNEQEAKQHWMDALGLPTADFYKTYRKPAGTGHRKNHLPWGICRVSIRRSANAWVRTMAWIDTLATDLRLTSPDVPR